MPHKYVQKDYIERVTGKKGVEIEIRTKIEIAITFVKEAVSWVLSLGFSKKRIYILSDSWYDSMDLIRTIKELGVNSVQFVKRDFWVRVKGKAVRIDEYFEKHKEWRYFKNEEEKRYFIKKRDYMYQKLDISKRGKWERRIYCYYKA